VSQDGLPSPVSIRRRVGPWPIRYVFVPVLWEFLVSWNDFFFFGFDRCWCVVVPWRVNWQNCLADSLSIEICISHFSWVAA
jgi:hypothetical protein